ncbi:MAG: aminotransferase class III-fold pyridoxal phosphate-dependent enzyme [Gammaproteobacteria bacterium]|nr:aminotransferase class III-fold pyridoxal phosphate-dependent enzyme [Gammaproteobacteria bacterium]
MNHFWMPFTANRDFKKAPRLFSSAKGMFYQTPDGREILDGSSGLFCCAAGHGRVEIARAVYQQLSELDYASPFQSAHPLAFQLANALSQIIPGDLNQIFFTCSGSEAVESAMRIALAYHQAMGQSGRTRFVSRERAYHGVNIGGASLGGMVKNRRALGPGYPNVVHMRHTWQEERRFVRGQDAQGQHLADDLKRFVQCYGAETIAACIVEPVAGSTGVLVPPLGYLQRLREICDEHQILLIFDEVICGFGRLGDAFAADAFGVVPDMMTMAKALTNGAQPMGAVAVSEKIHNAVINATKNEQLIELFHGYTYSAHPAACAAALATLTIYEEEQLFERAAHLSDIFLDAVFSLRDLPAITDIRGYGLLAGFDLKTKGEPGLHGYALQKALYEAGLHIKTTGDAGIIAPPLIAEEKHIQHIVDVLASVLKGVG